MSIVLYATPQKYLRTITLYTDNTNVIAPGSSAWHVYWPLSAEARDLTNSRDRPLDLFPRITGTAMVAVGGSHSDTSVTRVTLPVGVVEKDDEAEVDGEVEEDGEAEEEEWWQSVLLIDKSFKKLTVQLKRFYFNLFLALCPSIIALQ